MNQYYTHLHPIASRIHFNAHLHLIFQFDDVWEAEMETPMQYDQLPQLLKKSDLCERLSVSPRTIENMVKSGEFPPPVRIGKYVYWSEKTACLWQQRMFSEQENWGNFQ